MTYYYIYLKRILKKNNENNFLIFDVDIFNINVIINLNYNNNRLIFK